MRQREWEEMVRWAGVNCGGRDLRVRSAAFEGSTSIRGDVDIRGTIEIVGLRLLFHQQNKKTQPCRASSFNVPHDFV